MTNEKFRDILEAALQERYDSIPNPEDLDYDYEFSPEFEKKMQEMIENFSQIRKQTASEARASMDEKNGCRTSSKKRKRSERYGQKRIYNMHFRKALVIALVSALLMALAACAVHYVVIWNETNNEEAGTLDVTFDVENPENLNREFKHMRPTIPKGYEIASETGSPISTEIKYVKGDREIYYDQTGAVESLSMSINNEDNNFQETMINGYKGYTSHKEQNSHVVWCDGVSCFELIGNVDLEMLMAMAETIE